MSRTDSTTEILGVIRRVRRRLVLVAVLEAGLSAALGVLLLVSVAVLLAAQDLDPTPLRWAIGLGAMAALAGAFALASRRGLRVARSELEVALLIESRVPGLYSGVVSTLEFAGSPPEDPVSASLVAQLAARTAERLDGVTAAHLVDARRAERAAHVLGVVVIALGLLAIVVPGPFQLGLHTLIEGRAAASSARGPQSAEVESNVRDIRFRFVYPAYMRRPAREMPGAGGDISAPAGTVVEVRATALRASRDALLLMGSEERRPVPLSIEGGIDLAGFFTVSEPTTYSFRLVTRDGVRLDETGSHTVDVEPDHEPEVLLLAPEADQELNKQDRLVLVYQAVDDIGLGQVDVVYRRLGGGDVVRRRVATLDADLRHQGDATLDLADTDAKPGDTLEVWVEAFDQDTVGGPNVGRSEVRRVKIWSPEEKHEENVDRLAALVEVMLGVLADRLESPIDSLKLERWTDALDVASSANLRMQKVTAALNEVLAGIVEDPMMPAEVVGDLTAIRDRQDELRRGEERDLKSALVLDADHPRRREMLTLLWTDNNESVDALEEDIIKLEDLVDRLRQDKLMTQTRDLLSQQGQLMDLLDKLRKSGDPNDIAKAQEQIDALQDQLRNMMEQIAKQAKKLPFDNFNASALDPKGTHKDVVDFQKELDEIRELLAQGRIDEAMKKAEELQRAMGELMSSMEEGFEGMAGAASSEAQEKMSEMEQKLGEVAAAEKEVHEGTSEVAEARKEAMQEALGESLKELMREQKQKADAARAKLGEIGPSGMDPRDQGALDSGKEGLRELSERLEAEDIEQSLRLAEDAEQQLDQLASELAKGADTAEDGQRAGQLHEAGRKARQAGQTAGEIAEALRGLQPEPGEMMTPQDRERLAELSQKQGEARQKLESLGQEMKEMGPMPGMEGLEQLMEGAGQSMQQAEQRLSEKRPGEAQRSEEAALDALDRARKRMKQMMKPKQGGGPGMGLSHERAEIPKAEDYQVPAEFREEVLKAMREGAPKRFAPMIQKYYEELIR